MRSSLFLPLVLLFQATACGESDEGESLPEIDCAQVQVPAFAEVTAFSTSCVACHSVNRTGAARLDAPAEWNFDDYASAAMDPEEVVEEVYSGAMPPPELGVVLSEAEKQQIYIWGLCGPRM